MSNRQQVVDDLIYRIPRRHHIQIFNKCKGDVDKALLCGCRDRDKTI